MIAEYAADQIIQKSLDFFSAMKIPEETETPNAAIPVSRHPVTTSTWGPLLVPLLLVLVYQHQ